MARVHGEVDQRRDDHAARRRDPGQDPPWPGRELAVHDLALDLETDEQEEHRHQGVVDPVQDGEAADICCQHGKVGRGERRVGGEEGEERHAHQDHPAGGFVGQEGTKPGGRRPDRRVGHGLHVAEIQSSYNVG